MHDIRLGWRNLVQRPTFSAIAILTLALGIGANAAVFTVSNAVLLAPLPYENPEQIVVLHEHTPQFPSVSVTRYNYEDWRDRSKSFTGMAALRPTNMTLLGTSGSADPERVPVKMITATLLPILGVSVDQGRNFGEADDRAGAEGVALVSAGFAARRFPASRRRRADAAARQPAVHQSSASCPRGSSCFNPLTSSCRSGRGQPRCPRIAAGIPAFSPSRD